MLCLLSASELQFFSKPFLKTLSASGFKVSHVAPNDADAFERIVNVMERAESTSSKLVVHCASGQKRTGDALALWLHRRYRLPVEAAVSEISAFAKEHRLLRRPSVDGVLRLLAPNTLRPSPPVPPSWSVNTRSPRVSGTSTSPRKNTSDDARGSSFHVTVLQMGGEIDETYGSRERGVSEEAAATRVLQNMPFIGYTFDVRCVCRKDGARVDRSDRERLIKACIETTAPKILVTHGMSGLVDTALALRCVEALGSKTIVVVGATVPECMKRSDATFNMGVAFGALNVLRRGVFVCSNGRVFESARCAYDGEKHQHVPAPKRVPA